MRRSRTLLAAAVMALMPSHLVAQASWTPARPDALLSPSLLGHPDVAAGSLQVGYAFSTERFRDYRVSFLGTVLEPVSAEELLEFYPEVPERMTQNTHLFTAVYVPRDGLVLDARLPIHSNDMDVLTSGAGFSLSNSGIGDVQVNGSLRVLSWSRQRIDLHFGASFPSGSIDAADPAIDSLPYVMRNGIGTVAFYPGFTYQGQSNRMSWGFQLSWMIPTGTNDRSYRLGTSWQGHGWFGGNWNDWLSSSARLTWHSWGELDGEDPVLDPLISPLNDPLSVEGRQLESWLATSVLFPSGALKGQRLFVEFGFPLFLEVNTLRSRWGLRTGAAVTLFGPR